MKRKQEELDFVGGGRPLTKEDEIAISNFIRAQKSKRTGKHRSRTTRKKVTA